MSKLIAAALIAAALSPAGAAELTIAIDGVSSAEGQILVALYDSADSFRGKPLRAQSAPATAGAMQLRIKDLPPGDYAFAVYHDANGNGKLDRNLLGMPSEDYAFSNNAAGKRGPPEFEQARFALPPGGATNAVNLR
ncbi:DUF2141 domain-containing protein [Duganella aceris]|uniref:DUF2141 domain-containing protein n=1 Tax=Duganella aceris TaxID=2703883 RepID=A0ABX0FR71_9BURK|nr:DUF2141 domain-containing protein [Duganella aceris]NGZ87160.1 DUF2141 domain-containing protein [Duganella aceris]